MAQTIPHTLTGAFGDIEKKRAWRTIRDAAILTGSYVDTTDSVDLKEYEYAGLLFEVVKGSLTSLEYIIWQSIDGDTWFRMGVENVSTTIVSDSVPYYSILLAANVNYYKVVPVVAKLIKLQVKGTGTATGSTLAVHITGVR